VDEVVAVVLVVLVLVLVAVPLLRKWSVEAFQVCQVVVDEGAN
jgi:hypothetical protein